jgi:hypothetical protein
MNVFFFEVEVQRTVPTVVAILAEDAEQASILSGRLMLCINEVGAEYSGEGLRQFLRNRSKDRLQADLSATDTEGIVGYTKDKGLSILVLGDPERNEWLE